MALTIFTDGVKNYPMFFCDHCGKEILDSGMANALWPTPRKAEGCRTEVNYVHCECDDSFERDNPLQGNYPWSAMRLSLFLRYLGNNCGFDSGDGQGEKEGHDLMGW